MCVYCVDSCECDCPDDYVASFNHCTKCAHYFKGAPKDWEVGF